MGRSRHLLILSRDPSQTPGPLGPREPPALGSAAPLRPPPLSHPSRLDYPLRPSPPPRAAHSVAGAILRAVELVSRLRLFRPSRAGPERYRRPRAQFIPAERPQFHLGRRSAGNVAARLSCSLRQRWALSPPWARRPLTRAPRVSAPAPLAGGDFASGAPMLGGPDLPLKPLPGCSGSRRRRRSTPLRPHHLLSSSDCAPDTPRGPDPGPGALYRPADFVELRGPEERRGGGGSVHDLRPGTLLAHRPLRTSSQAFMQLPRVTLTSPFISPPPLRR